MRTFPCYAMIAITHVADGRVCARSRVVARFNRIAGLTLVACGIKLALGE